MRAPDRIPEPATRTDAAERARARAAAEERPSERMSRVADGAGVLGAVLAALCCAGTPLVLAGLTAIGLGFLRKDAILWPLMLASLLVALWAFWRGTQTHGRFGPLVLGTAGAIALAAGVIVVHGFPAMPMIYGGAALLVAATFWNVLARRACAPVTRR